VKNKKIKVRLKEGAIINAKRDLKLADDNYSLEEKASKLADVERLGRIVADWNCSI
jgi:hypothetical protein